MVNQTGDVVEEYEDQHNTMTSNMTTTTASVQKFNRQNGTNGISITDQVLTNNLTSVNNVQVNGSESAVTKIVEAVTIINNDHARILAEPEAWKSLVKPVNSEFLDGPDQVLPASDLSITKANGRVKLRLEENGVGALKPLSVPGLLHKTALEHPDFPALATKEKDGQWKFITYKEYEKEVRTCAKAFLKLGLKRYHSVCIMGFNSPEWFISDLGAIYAGGIAAGIYTTNSPDACHYCALKSRANIIVVEDKKQLDKILEIKNMLPDLKVIVQYSGTPDVEGVLSWEELMKIGSEESDEDLDNILKTIGVNECCTLVYTSGTVGNPKAAMLSHDNFTWDAESVAQYMGVTKTKEVIVSFLPLSHVAAQILDIYIGITAVATVYFADKDALKGSLVKTLQEVHPTRFLAVPRVWEKIYEKMQEVGSQSGAVKKMIASWAKGQAFQHHMDRMNGINSNTISYYVAKTLIFSRIKQALGLDRCVTTLSGAAPISVDIKKYFMSIDIPVMDAFGMSETTGGHTLNNNEYFRLEATGRARPGVHSKIVNPDEEQQGEVCLGGRHIFMGYLGDPEKTAEALDEEGWLHSGDLGKIDEDGYLYITGRIKELIITAGGENIAPAVIEEEIKAQLPCISNAMLIGDKRKFLSILLTLKTEMNVDSGEPLDKLLPAAKQWLKDIGCEADTVKDVIGTDGPSEKVLAAIQKGIDAANKKAVSNAQRVQKFKILSHDFSIPTGEIGPTMKLKRNVAAKKYTDIIERFYQET